MKINYKKLILFIIIPIVIGSIIGLITNSGSNYNNLNQPSFAPPGFIFPIVWTILYGLMGVSLYIISESNNYNKYTAFVAFIFQIIVNYLWSFLFFTFNLRLLSFLWILLLIYLVIKMLKIFYSISKWSSYLQIPYLLWLIYAAFLNLFVYLLNV